MQNTFIAGKTIEYDLQFVECTKTIRQEAIIGICDDELLHSYNESVKNAKGQDNYMDKIINSKIVASAHSKIKLTIDLLERFSSKEYELGVLKAAI